MIRSSRLAEPQFAAALDMAEPSAADSIAGTLIEAIAAANVEAHQGNHTCALLQDGSVMCWGANETGQLGDGTITPRFVPTRAKIN